MSRIRFTKSTQLIAGLLTGLLFAILVVPLVAQTAMDSGPYYDVSKEVTLTGTVSTLLTRPAPGMAWGSHLLLTTVSGTVDASLGNWAFVGKDALSVAPGQQLQITGVMKTINDKQVFLARVVTVGSKVYTLRDQHGLPLSSQSRERAARKGESL